MKRLILAALVIGLIAPAIASADDYNPPAWRYGENTTYAEWSTWIDMGGVYYADYEFNNSGNGYAELSTAAPTAEVVSYSGRDDVLHVQDWDDYEGIDINIPNYDTPNPYKEVHLQVVWHWDGFPGYAIDPAGNIIHSELNVDLGDGWYYDYIVWRLEPNPTEETITLTNEWGDLFIGQIVVDTICAPEPASLALLAIGGLAVIRRKR